ncbi:lasso peptide biosynthesis B2 protein [Thermodesulfobacteriota bacterium]
MDFNNLRYLRSPRNIFLFIKVFFSLLILNVLFSTLKLPSLLKIIDQKRKRSFNNMTIENAALFSNFILYRIFRTKRPCTLRSLLLFKYLRSMGKDTKIVFGVKDEGGELKGHAWLINEQRPFLENSDQPEEYEIIYEYPPSGNTGH